MKKGIYISALMCTAALMLGGCGGDNDNTSLIKEIESIAIDTVADPSVKNLDALELSCRVYYSDSSSADVTQHVTWSSSDTAIASVNSGLVERASSDGAEVNITVGYEHLSDFLAVNVFALSDINVSISDSNVTVNSTYQMTATGTFTDTKLDANSSGDITSGVIWSVSDSTVGTVDAAGLLTTLEKNDTVEVMAKVFDINGTIDLNVSL